VLRKKVFYPFPKSDKSRRKEGVKEPAGLSRGNSLAGINDPCRPCANAQDKPREARQAEPNVFSGLVFHAVSVVSRTSYVVR